MTAPECNVPGGCGLPARAVVLALPSEEMIGNAMGVWSVHWRCDDRHVPRQDVRALTLADPGATVLVFRLPEADGAGLAPGDYIARIAGAPRE